ncbi:hypothetical protein ABZ901_31710 [Actinacidiphila alni]|uniref:hypothetical protein n=1 Tax=Actinacidiphila alni TaxID=380248 RepID=UPI0034108BD7
MMWFVMLVAALTGRLGTRRQRALAAAAAERDLPGRLAVLRARPLYPAAAGAEVTFRVTDDPDAVVHVRVDREPPGQGELAKAVADGLAAAERWRDLHGAFADGGHDVLALDRLVAEPWIAADITNETVAELLDGVGRCLARREHGAPMTVLIAHPEVAARLPDRDPGAPTLLRLTARRRLAALSGGRPYHRAWFEWRDGQPLPGTGHLTLVRPFEDRQRYAAAVEASAAVWLAGADPSATVCSAGGVWRLLPGRVDRLTGFVVYRDEPEPGPVFLGKHALRVTTDLDGALVGTPEILRDVREGRGPLRLPAL